MPGKIILAVAQPGSIQRSDSRERVVARLIDVLKSRRNADFVVFL